MYGWEGLTHCSRDYGLKLVFETILGLHWYKGYTVKSEICVSCAVNCNLVV